MRDDYYTHTEVDAGRWQTAHGEDDFNPRDVLDAEEYASHIAARRDR